MVLCFAVEGGARRRLPNKPQGAARRRLCLQPACQSEPFLSPLGEAWALRRQGVNASEEMLEACTASFPDIRALRACLKLCLSVPDVDRAECMPVDVVFMSWRWCCGGGGEN